jgi:hypothetical protein
MSGLFQLTHRSEACLQTTVVGLERTVGMKVRPVERPPGAARRAHEDRRGIGPTHVLPNEWISSWDADALGAGAMAVKEFGQKRATTGNAAYLDDQGHCADVRDNVDGYYDPGFSTAQATLAIEATYGSIAYQNGAVFFSTYFGGQSYPCAHIDPPDPFAGWMSQWGTQYCAQARRSCGGCGGPYGPGPRGPWRRRRRTSPPRCCGAHGTATGRTG